MSGVVDLDVSSYSNKELLNFLDFSNSIPHNKEIIIEKYDTKIAYIANSDLRKTEKDEFISFITEVKEKVINIYFNKKERQEYNSGELIKNSENFMKYDNNITNTKPPVIKRI